MSAIELIDSTWLAGALGFGGLPTPHDVGPVLRVVHAEWANGATATEFARVHIPSAVLFDTDWIEDGYPTWKLLPLPLLRRRFAAVGLRPHDTIAVYARDLATAARVWWTLRYCGAQDVRVLHGGLSSWLSHSFPVDSCPVSLSPIANDRSLNLAAAAFRAPTRQEWLVTTETMMVAVRQGNERIVDVRSADEYLGNVSGYDYLDRSGRIPGALHADIAAWINHLEDARLDALRDAWRRLGILNENDPRRTIFYCGSGWRSSVACLAARALGYTNVANYSDGWCGWSTEYRRDASASGSTPGWSQVASERPIVSGQ